MEDTRIAYTNDQGGVSVVVPAKEMFDENSKTRALLPQLKGRSNQEILEWIIAKDVPAGKAFHILTASGLPGREFRNAWKIEGNNVGHDIVKCRNIWKDKMRAVREPLLKALDVEYQKADEAGDQSKKQQIAAKKRTLRDVTIDPRIEAAQTLEALKLVWPEPLGAQ